MCAASEPAHVVKVAVVIDVVLPTLPHPLETALIWEFVEDEFLDGGVGQFLGCGAQLVQLEYRRDEGLDSELGSASASDRFPRLRSFAVAFVLGHQLLNRHWVGAGIVLRVVLSRGFEQLVH